MLAEHLGARFPGLRREIFPIAMPSFGSATLRVGERTWSGELLAGSGGTGGACSAAVCDGGHGSRRALAPERCGGKIVVMAWPRWRHRVVLQRRALAAGALAVVFHSPLPRQGLAALEDDDSERPVLVVGDDCCRSGLAQLHWQTTRRSATGCNFLVESSGEGPPLLCIAHYDAWGPGCLDNAAGVYLLLRLAAGARRHRLPALTCLWSDAEEVGLQGAAHHLQHQRSYRGCLNIDMPLRDGQSHLPPLLIGNRRYWRRGSPWRAACSLAVPLGLDWLYALPGRMAPADVHHAHLAGLPALSTWCPSRLQHSPADRFVALRLADVPRQLARLRRLCHDWPAA
jgi:hypothetical protein